MTKQKFDIKNRSSDFHVKIKNRFLGSLGLLFLSFTALISPEFVEDILNGKYTNNKNKQNND